MSFGARICYRQRVIRIRTILGWTQAARRARLALIACLTLSLLGSMLHCAASDDTFAAGGAIPGVAVAQGLQHGTAPDSTDRALSCHSGHCLSHTIPNTAEPRIATAVALTEAPQFAQETPAAPIAGLRLFKPPRA
jgi:hypothetical protein